MADREKFLGDMDCHPRFRMAGCSRKTMRGERGPSSIFRKLHLTCGQGRPINFEINATIGRRSVRINLEGNASP